MLQLVLSKTYITWICISSLSGLLIFLSLYQPEWVYYRKTVERDTDLCTGTHHKSLGPLIICDVYCGIKSEMSSKCDWIWTELFHTFKANSVYDVVIFICDSVATGFLSFGLLMAFISAFVRDIRKISVFKLSGVSFLMTVLILCILLMFWFLTWPNPKFQSVCSQKSKLFDLGDCKTGWSIYTFGIGCVLCIIAGIMANFVDKSLCNEEVEEHLLVSNQINFV